MNMEMGQGTGTLTRAAGLVADAKGDFDSLSKQLEAQIHGLQGRWVGQGGQAFFALHAAWTTRQREIVSALDTFEASLRSTERDNVRTDEAQQANHQRSLNRLGWATNRRSDEPSTDFASTTAASTRPRPTSRRRSRTSMTGWPGWRASWSPCAATGPVTPSSSTTRPSAAGTRRSTRCTLLADEPGGECLQRKYRAADKRGAAAFEIG